MEPSRGISWQRFSDREAALFQSHNQGNEKDAQKYLNGVLREIDLGTFVEPSAILLEE
jgi:hypothetical protein